MARYNKIFAALDGSDAQEAVARRTLSIAHDNNAEVLFGHVIDSSKFMTSGVGDDGIKKNMEATIRNAISRQLARAEKDDCIPAVDVKVAMGPISQTMLDELINPFNADLVICGVRGLSNFKYAFVGSVSTDLVRNAKCDVLVVRPEAIDDLPEHEYLPYES